MHAEENPDLNMRACTHAMKAKAHRNLQFGSIVCLPRSKGTTIRWECEDFLLS